MLPPVLIYSSDGTRGRIVQRSVQQHGIQARYLSTAFEVKEAAKVGSWGALVVDARQASDQILELCAALTRQLPLMSVIIFSASDPLQATVVNHPDGARIEFVSGPFDPEIIGSRVKVALADRHWGRRRLAAIAAYCRAWLHKNFLTIAVALAALAAGLTGGYLFWCIDTMPAVESLDDYSPYQASAVYSSDNILITEFYVERRNFIPYERIPGNVKNALLAVEDNRFYQHHGVDPLRLLGALFTNIRKWGYIQGGSTITQQLAKMLFLSPQRTLTRKIQELVLSFQIEARYSKDEILGLYCNQAYFGSRAYGIDAAAHAYFGKAIGGLTIAEAALLAALLKAPSDYSPFKSPRKALERRDHALERMYAADYIDHETYKNAMQTPLPEQFHHPQYKAPYFVDYCRPILEKKYGQRIYTSGLKIYTTLDYRLQLIAEKAVVNGISVLEQRGVEGAQAALVAVDLQTGAIVAMVGGTDYNASKFNRATQAMRQPGSAFKPLVYLTALTRGFTPEHTIDDRLVTYKINHRRDSWTPHNYGNVYYQQVSLKRAMAKSLNAATVNLAKRVRIDNIIAMARKVGIQSRIYRYYSSALGASELTLMELVGAYAALATGRRIEPICLERIIDREQLALVEPTGRREQVIEAEQLDQIRGMLRAVVLEGTGRRAQALDRSVYGKTGTTNASADALFIGFDDRMAVGVWVGMDNRTSLGKRETGASAALPIWIDFMAGAGTNN